MIGPVGARTCPCPKTHPNAERADTDDIEHELAVTQIADAIDRMSYARQLVDDIETSHRHQP